MAEIASAVGRSHEAAEYEALATAVREAFAKAYVSPSGRLEPETQTAYVLGLGMDLLPDERCEPTPLHTSSRRSPRRIGTLTRGS